MRFCFYLRNSCPPWIQFVCCNRTILTAGASIRLNLCSSKYEFYWTWLVSIICIFYQSGYKLNLCANSICSSSWVGSQPQNRVTIVSPRHWFYIRYWNFLPQSFFERYFCFWVLLTSVTFSLFTITITCNKYSMEVCFSKSCNIVHTARHSNANVHKATFIVASSLYIYHICLVVTWKVCLNVSCFVFC